MTSTRDQAIADNTQDPVDAVGRCVAHGCPNIWTTKSSLLCHWHSAAHPHDWPAVTDELQREVTDRAMERQNAERAPTVSLLQKREILGRLRRLFTRPTVDPMAWAHTLKASHEAGERLSAAQNAMWRGALRPGRRTEFADLTGGLTEREAQRAKVETQRKVDAALAEAAR